MDCINIYGLEVFGNHGVLKEENVLGQKFIVNVKLFLDTTESASTDDVELTINYADVCMMITKHFKENTYKLIETAANKVAHMLLITYKGLNEVEIEVQKPWAPVGLPLNSVSVKINRKKHNVYIGLGSNMGDKEDNILKALEIISNDKYSFVSKVSSFIETKPYGMEEQDNFLNGAALIKTLRTPEEFLELIGQIESELKRIRQVHWGPRTIDVDILFYDDVIMNTKDLIIPHYDIKNREFVLGPMHEIAPGYKHPVCGNTIAKLYLDLINHY